MKPHARPPRAGSERRVRNQLDAHLGWIHGWPLGGGRWQVVPPPRRGAPAVVPVDDAALARAARCWAKTTGPYREAFARAVPDPSAWRALVPARLAEARAQLEGAGPDVPRTPTAAVERALATSADLDAARSWAQAHAPALERAGGPVRQVQLAWLAARHGARVDVLLELLAGDEPPVSAQGVVGALKASLLPGKDLPEVPAGAWKAVLWRWVDARWAARDRVTARALDWLPLALPVPVRDAWSGWWLRAAAARRVVHGYRVRTTNARQWNDPHTLAARQRAGDAIAALPAPPPPAHVRSALDAVAAMAAHGVTGAHGVAWMAPTHGPMAPADLMERWAPTARADPQAARLFSRIGADLARDPRRARMWRAHDHGVQWGPGFDALEQPEPVAVWRLMVRLHDTIELAPSETDAVAELHTLDPGRAMARAVALRGLDLLQGLCFWEGALRAASRVAGDDPDAFAAVLQLLHGDRGRERLPIVQQLGTDASRVEAIVGRRPLTTAAASLILARFLGAPVPAWLAPDPAPLPVALARYPEALRPALARLAAVHPDPIGAAAAVLDRDLPPPDKLRRQLAALRAADPQRHAARIANLLSWLTDPPVPSPVRLERLAGKLDAAALRARFDAWAAEVAGLAAAARRERFGDQPGLDTPRAARILGAVGTLAPPYRHLVERLLAKRAGPAPWDLRDDPVHVALLQRWRDLGLDPAPWLSPPERTLQVDGETLRVAVATDPLDVLWMGGPFFTCLAPGQFNFFSAVANATDLDKHVLVAWRGTEIAARCLVAVGESGALVAFHAYGGLPGFGDVVGAWARDVAEAMGTAVAPRAVVKARLTPAWYDDGPRNHGVGLDFLGAGSDWLEAHAEASPAAFVDAVERQLGAPLVPALIPAMLDTAALFAHPRWVQALVPRLPLPVDPWTALQAGALLLRAGHPDRAWKVAGAAIRAHLGPQLRRGARLADEALVRLWVAHDPVGAQRSLRHDLQQVRWSDPLWADALDALGRPVQAAKVRAGRRGWRK